MYRSIVLNTFAQFYNVAKILISDITVTSDSQSQTPFTIATLHLGMFQARFMQGVRPYLYPVQSVSIKECDFINSTLTIFYVSYLTEVNITDTTFLGYNKFLDGIYLSYNIQQGIVDTLVQLFETSYSIISSPKTTKTVNNCSISNYVVAGICQYSGVGELMLRNTYINNTEFIILISYFNKISMDNCIVSNTDYGIWARNCNELSITNCRVSKSKRFGTTAQGVATVSIANSYFAEMFKQSPL